MGPRSTQTAKPCGPSATNVSFQCSYPRQAVRKEKEREKEREEERKREKERERERQAVREKLSFFQEKLKCLRKETPLLLQGT